MLALPKSRANLPRRRSSTHVSRTRRPGPETAAAAAASAAAAAADGAPRCPLPPPAPLRPSSLAALLAPHVGRRRRPDEPLQLPAAIFWDADNVRPSAAAVGGGGGDGDGSPRPRREAAVRRRLEGLARELQMAGLRVVSAAAYGNAATLAGAAAGGGGEDDDRDDSSSSCCRLVVTSAGKRQSADMALQSDLAAFVSAWAPPPPPIDSGAPRAPSPRLTCLVLLIADDAGYAGACAWASASGAAVVACGLSAARRGRYAPPSAPAEPWRHHPLARAGAAVVVPWVVATAAAAAAEASDSEDDDGGGWGPDAGAAWINPEGVFGDGGGVAVD